MNDIVSFDPANVTYDEPVTDKKDIVSYNEPISGTEATLRGISGGALFNYAPQISALAKSSGMYPEKDITPSYTKLGPIETVVGAGRIALEKVAPSIFGDTATKTYQETAQAEKEARGRARKEHPTLSMAGELTGAVINPITRVGGPKAGASFTENVMRGAGPNAIIGGIYGSGEGDTWTDKAYNAAMGALGGSLFGGTVSGVAGKFAKPAAVAGTQPTAEDVARAAARLSSQGAAITVPRVVASESEPLLTASSMTRDVPIAGTPLKKAGEKLLGEIETKAGELAAGETRGLAGSAAKENLEQWISKGWRQDVEDAYNEVNNLLTTNNPTSMTNTRGMMDVIQSELREARLPTDTPAIKMIQDAATDPQGLTYEGMKTLRTKLGEALENPTDILKPALPEIRRLYGAVTNDLRNAVRANGGKDALKAFDEANKLNIESQKAREQLLKITGQTTASKSAEGVFDTLYKMAGSKAGSDIEKLKLAKETLPFDVWNSISRGMIDHMGTSPKTNAFEPNALFGNYARLSDEGKDLLFGTSGSVLRNAMDDLATVGTRINRLNAIAAPEGGAERKLATAAEIIGAVLHPIKTAGFVGTGRIFANLMSEPATAESVARWARAYEMFASKPSKATASAFNAYSRALGQQIGGRYGLPSQDQIIHGLVAGSETAKGINYLYNQAFGDDTGGARPSQYDYPKEASGGRVQRAYGGKVGVLTAQSLLSDLKRRKIMLANKTEQMLSLPDDAVVQALDAAKR